MDVVTGAAGFIGSHLSERLLRAGREVVGIDCLTDYYDPARKVENLVPLLEHDAFRLEALDLADRGSGLGELLAGAERVFHLAGEPGVRASWGASFGGYVRRNVLATQSLLEACAEVSVPRVVYASSSSVYGDAPVRPTHEGVLPSPRSPYGVSKLAAEHLCQVYGTELGLSVASLRLFTVYGPRQRPDMAFSRLVDAAVRQQAFVLNDDGLQERDFTYVDDVVDAFVAAGERDWSGVANIGGGSPVTMRQAIGLLTELCGPVEVLQAARPLGDVRCTAADIDVARRALGYDPSTPLPVGLERMVAWARQRVEVAA